MVPLSVEGSPVARILAFGDNIVLNVALLLVLFLLMLLSAFFSACEMGYSSVNIIRLKNYQEEKRKGSKKAVYIAEKFDVTLTTILIGNNFVNIAATALVAYILGTFITNPTVSTLINTFGMTIIVLIFGEILPKQIAKERPEQITLKFAGLLYIFIKALWPITFLFMKLKKVATKRQKNKEISPYMTEDELESIIDVMEDQGVIDEDDAELITSAINLNEVTVYEIMTPRVDMIAIDIKDSIESIKELFFEYQFSRMPVYRDDKDNIIGILSERNFFTAYIKANGNLSSIDDIITGPYFVTKSLKVSDLIRELQNQKKHFAIVSDEYGGTSGIVTMEDALEELVGEIYDESDEETMDEILKISNDKYLISADIELDELYEKLKLGKAPISNYSTIGGYLYSSFDGFPSEGEVISFKTVYEEIDLENPVLIVYGLCYEIAKVENRRIREVILTITTLEENNKNKITE